MSNQAPYKFRLYIAGDAHNSSQALANLKSFCIEHLPDQHEIEIVDVLLTPERALRDGIMLTPMLLKLSPEPRRKIVGSLSQWKTVLQALDLHG